MNSHSSKEPPDEKAQQAVKAERPNRSAGTLTNDRRWVQAATPPTPRWR